MLKIRKKIYSARPNKSPGERKCLEETAQNLNLSNPERRFERVGKNGVKNALGFFNLRKSKKRTGIKQLDSLHSNGSSNKESKSNVSYRNELYQSQVGILKEELELTWTAFKITEQHKNLFLSSLEGLPNLKAAIKIAREIDTIEKGSSNITSVLNTISIRELKLVTFKSHLQDSPLDPIFFSKSIESLRELSLRLIDFIEIWKKDINHSDSFIWEGQNYYEKMQTDSDFIAESELNKFFCLYKSDPLFLGPTNIKKVGKRFYSVPYCAKQSSRIKRSQEILGYFPIKPDKPRSLSTKEILNSSAEPPNSSVSLFFQTEVVQFDSEYIKFIQNISKSIFEAFLNESIVVNTQVLVVESCKEILLASLTLHSSSILDKIISEVLGEMIPSIAKNSHTEVTDSEYLDVRNAILSEVFYEEMHFICSSQTNDLLSLFLTDEIFCDFDLSELVVETMDEEKQENMKIVYIVSGNILDEFLNSEWSEEIAEVELINAKMEFAWIGLPSHIQREIYWHQKANIILRVSEMVYFSILNDFVGNIWLEGALTNILNELQGKDLLPDNDIFLLKDPSIPQEDPKKFVTTKLIRKK